MCVCVRVCVCVCVCESEGMWVGVAGNRATDAQATGSGWWARNACVSVQTQQTQSKLCAAGPHRLSVGHTARKTTVTAQQTARRQAWNRLAAIRVLYT